ncbi:MAG: tetratricopeptide repeat protein, partial [Candidatus Edwardsbacteria bacterium]|nr:tetratricopeptide repeat protein [Candidatus Edwardsbacteria bacterium]
DNRKALDQFEKSLRFAEKAGDFGRGIAAAKRILYIDKDRIELYNKLADFYNRLELKTGAIRNWLKYADQLSLRSDLTAVAAVYKRVCDLGPSPQLVELCQRIEALAHAAPVERSEDSPEPADITPHRRLVDVALKMGNPRKIVETQLTYARILQKKGFLRKAKGVYQKILEREPDNAEALEKILSCSGGGEVDEGKTREQLQSVTRQFQELVWNRVSETYEPYYDLGVLLRQNGLRDDAVTEFQMAIKGGERQLKGFEMLAVSFLESGDYGLASEVLNQGLSVKKFIDNEYVGLHYNLGVAQEQLGNLDKALEEYEQVYILDIAYKDVAARLRRIEAALKERGPRPAAAPARPGPSPAPPAETPAIPAPIAAAAPTPAPAGAAAKTEPVVTAPVSEASQELVSHLKQRLGQVRETGAANVAAPPVQEPEPAMAAVPDGQEAAEDGPADDGDVMPGPDAPGDTVSDDGAFISEKDQGLSFL